MLYKNKRGFTLIELLVVIAIIGILSSVVLASLNTAREKSRDARRISDIKQLQLALELYFDTNSEYPPAAVAADASTALADLVTDGYIASIPTDPVGGAEYQYISAAASATNFCIGATLEGTANELDTCQTLDAGGTYQVGP
ncbi:MAG TPA: prepilin-type N-terminal cleavage/methylation domain-containing protein [Candidatus Paceibacterota bacterium]